MKTDPHRIAILETPATFTPEPRPPWWRPFKRRAWRRRQILYSGHPMILASLADAKLIAHYLATDATLDVVRVEPAEGGAVSVTLRSRGEPQVGMPKWIEKAIENPDDPKEVTD